MSMQTINPYPSLGKYTEDGLENLIKTISGTPTFEDFNKTIEAFIIKTFGFNKPVVLTEMEITSIVPHAVNAYINHQIASTTSAQAPIVDLLLNKLKEVPALQIPDFILDIEDNITRAQLSLKEQIPLLFATQIGKTVFDYWLKQITDGSTSPWARFLNTNSAVDIANLPYWLTTAMQSALLFSHKNDYSNDIKDGLKIAGPDFITALTAAIGLSAGKVIYKWVPRVMTQNKDFKIIEEPQFDIEKPEGEVQDKAWCLCHHKHFGCLCYRRSFINFPGPEPVF